MRPRRRSSGDELIESPNAIHESPYGGRKLSDDSMLQNRDQEGSKLSGNRPCLRSRRPRFKNNIRVNSLKDIVNDQVNPKVDVGVGETIYQPSSPMQPIEDWLAKEASDIGTLDYISLTFKDA